MEQDQQELLETLHASAVKFLIEGGEEEAANILLACRAVQLEYGSGAMTGDRYVRSCWMHLRGPRVACDVMQDSSTKVYQQIHSAFSSVFAIDLWLEEIVVRGELVDIDPNWHSELLDLARGRGISNQARIEGATRTWQGLRFRSATEIRIAAALDNAALLFFPLPTARLNGQKGRRNLEPDFLICHEGRWGILEVDGEPYHPPQRSAHEHERDRLFHKHGVRVVQRFDATDCYADPDKVVSDFLRILKQNYG